jgi:hypothetical protein
MKIMPTRDILNSIFMLNFMLTCPLVAAGAASCGILLGTSSGQRLFIKVRLSSAIGLCVSLSPESRKERK